MLRVNQYKPTLEFPLVAKEAMHNGVVYEGDTGAALTMEYGSRITEQLYLGNRRWSCKADFVLDHGTQSPVIIEHKAVGDKWWNYDGKLPDTKHVTQLVLYKELYEEMFKVTPRLILYYRAWGHWAELELNLLPVGDDGIQRIEVTGMMDDEEFSKLVAIDPVASMKILEDHYEHNHIPAPYPHKVDGECTFKGKPSCPMYGHCWKE